MLDRACQDVGDGLDAAMRMPGKTGQIIRWIVVAKIVQQQEGIEILGLAETKGTLQLDSCALQRGLGLYDLFDWA